MSEAAPKPTSLNPRSRMIEAFRTEYEDDFLEGDYEALADAAFNALREPSAATVDLFLEELTGEWGQKPDPSAEGDRQAIRTTERRLAITYAWRRAIDLMKRGRS